MDKYITIPMKEYKALRRCAEALDGLVLVCGRTGDSLTDFEEQAREFQSDTGKMRPGKDVPAACGDIGATREEYHEWSGSKVANARAALKELADV